jgi:ribonuclease BN (tRNA processing enzyme)
LGANIEFCAVPPGESISLRGAKLRAVANPHGSTTALAFRIDADGRSLVYASDVGYEGDTPSREALDLYRGANLLVHDSTYTPADRETRRERGLSSYADAAAVAVQAAVDHLVLFHYDQDYTDDMVDDMVTACRAELDHLGGKKIRLTAAREGFSLEP